MTSSHLQPSKYQGEIRPGAAPSGQRAGRPLSQVVPFNFAVDSGTGDRDCWGVAQRMKLISQGRLRAWILAGWVLGFGPVQAQEVAATKTILCEAEEFRIVQPGWRAQKYGANYYAATFAD